MGVGWWNRGLRELLGWGLNARGLDMNISAKHEGGDPDIEKDCVHPSDILDYFRDKEEIIASGD